MANEKHVFWQALIFTIIIFSIGLIMGYFLENSRADKIELSLLNSEINILDQQIRNKGISQFEIDCDVAKESTFSFANKIYDEAVQLERYDSQAKFVQTTKILHKRYDLLRTLLWMESIDIKKECNDNFHTIVYLFDYSSPDLEKKAQQASTSKVLVDLKNKYGNRILLIPLASNLDLESIELIKQKFKINSIPVIIIDEKTIIHEIPRFQELEETIFNTGNDKPHNNNL